MSAIYQGSTKSNRLTAVQAAVNSLTFNAPSGTASAGSLVIGTSSFVNTAGTTGVSSSSTGVLAIETLPPGGVTVSGSTLTLLASAASASATGTGTAANAAVVNNAGVVVVGGLTVGVSGTDVTLNSTAISSGQTVTINTFTINHP